MFMFKNIMRYAFGRSGILILSLILIIGVAWGTSILMKYKKNTQFSAAEEVSSESSPFPKNYPVTNKISPNFQLIDQFGKRWGLEKFQGRSIILTFVFAHCTTMCPLVVKVSMEAALKSNEKPILIAITLDPWRDTPSTLAAAAENWGFKEDMYYLSGNVSEVNKLIDAFDYPRQRDEESGEISHPGLIYLLDKKGRIYYTLNNPSSDWIMSALNRMIKESNQKDFL